MTKYQKQALPTRRHEGRVNPRLLLSKCAAYLLAKRRGLVSRLATHEGIGCRAAARELAQMVLIHVILERLVGRSISAHPWIAAAMKAGRPPSDTVTAILRNDKSHDSITNRVALAYASLFSQSDRRRRGVFFTPPAIAKVLAYWAVRSVTDQVLDPAVGPGVFLRAAFDRLRALGAHKASSQLTGVDVSILARSFSAAVLAPELAKPRFIHSDFLKGYHPKKRFDAIICNPPYTRHHLLKPTYKEYVGRAADVLLQERLPRTAGLHVHFLLKATSLLKPNGRFAFVVSQDLIGAKYGKCVLNFLFARCKSLTLVLFDPTSTAPFDGVRTTAMFVLGEVGSSHDDTVKVIRVRTMPSPRQLVGALNTWKGSRTYAWGTVRLVSREELSKQLGATRKGVVVQNPPRLGDVVQVRRGVATGANRFFLLNSREAAARGIGQRYLIKAIGRAKLVHGHVITAEHFRKWDAAGERVWLFVANGRKSKAVSRYLDWGRRQEVHHRRLCRDRKRWYELELLEPPPVLFTYMVRKKPRFIWDAARVVPLNVFHAVYGRSLRGSTLRALVEQLNSRRFQRKLVGVARFYGAGLLKFEPGRISRMTLPKKTIEDLNART